MSLYFWAMIVGIPGGLLMLVIIFSLLSLAQKEEDHLAQMGLGEAGGWLNNCQKGASEVSAEPMRATGVGSGS